MSYNDCFKLDLPAGWEDQTVHVFQGPRVDDTDHMLMVMVDRHLQFDDISDFALKKIKAITEVFPDIEILKEEPVTIEGGNPVYEFVYKWYPGEIPVYQKYIYVICDDLGFTFTCKFSKLTLKTVEAHMIDIVEELIPGTYREEDEDN